ncbi:MAG: ArsR family transcriptional regulator [Asgard group archaeon]|nr:ArsR family transcriptional regulator [Asgard group archaeon]
MIYLSELLVDTMTEYADSSQIETKTIKQLKSLSKELNEIASYQLSQHLFIETTILESKIAKQEFQFDKAFRLLNKAHKLATQRGLTSLMGKISSEYKELFKKGDTPFLILLFILINERSLTEISDFLNISKAATSKHLKLLLNLDLIKISKEKKVRSSNIKAKYYILSSHAHTLLSPLEITLIDIFKLASKDPTSLRERFDSMKFIIRIWRKFHELTLGYLDIVENQIIPEAQGLKIKIDLEKNDFDSIIQNLNQNDSLKMYQYAINNNQYQEFLVYWNEFNNKVKSLVEKGIKDDEKQQLIFTLFLPVKALLEIESLKKRRESQ